MSINNEEEKMIILFLLTIESVNVKIKSDGADGGYLAARVFYPLSPRYSQGSPVVIYVPGADDRGTLDAPVHNISDVISISFLFPGGRDPISGITSDGFYDHRGINCLTALRDIIKFALGKLPDSSGKYLHEIIPISPLYENVGIVASSNGGNTAFSTLGIFGEEISDIAWAIEWESPAGEQFATVDLGSIKKENPQYIPYSAHLTSDGIVCDLDYSNFKFDEDAVHPKGGFTGVLYFDMNNNDRFDEDTDYEVGAYVGVFDGKTKRVFSTQSLQHAIEKGYPDPLGEDFATLSEARDFWKIRDMSKMFDSIINKLPHLKIIIIGTEKDHVQGTIDHPHVVMPYRIFKDKGIPWIRFLPDSVYVAEVYGGDCGARDNPAGIDITLHNIENFLEPEGIRDDIIKEAAILELSDRTFYNRWEDDVDEIIKGIEEDESSNSIIDINQRYILITSREKTELEIFSIDGSKIKEVAGSGVIKINIDKLPPGIYFLKIGDEKKTEIKKILKFNI